MTVPSPSLSQHLLTRADLAKLGISAGSILAWLADRLLEPVGSLPATDAERDEVFAVPDRDHRLMLAGRLAAIGKKEIVFSPPRVRALLQCAIGRDPKAANEGAAGGSPAALDVTREMLAHDTDVFVEMTRQEAQRETAESGPGASGGPDPRARAARVDAEDLIGALDAWGAAAPAPTAFDEPAATDRHERPEPAVAQAMTRVESFLGELRHALVELANRPQPQAVDVQPLVAAMQSGFVHSAEQLGDLGKRVEAGVASAVRTALDHETTNQMAGAPPSFIVARTDRSTIALFGIAFLLLCWAAIFWFKTGSPRLAFGALVGANLIGCCLVVGRRRG